MTPSQTAFLDFHRARPAPHRWAWTGGRKPFEWTTFTATRFLSGRRGKTNSLSIDAAEFREIGDEWRSLVAKAIARRKTGGDPSSPETPDTRDVGQQSLRRALSPIGVEGGE